MSRVPPSRLLWLGIACALACATPAQSAGKPAGSPAWVFTINSGAGSLDMVGDSLGRDVGTGMQLRLDRILNSRVAAGFQVRLWGKKETDSIRSWTAQGTDTLLLAVADAELTRSVTILTMTATVSPTGRGAYVRGGAGVCSVRQQFVHHFSLYFPPGHNPATAVGIRSEQRNHDDVGFAVSAGGGWEHRLWPRIGLTADVEYARFVTAHIGGNLLSGNAGLKYYW